MSTVILRLRKVEFLKQINLGNILFVRFVKFEIKKSFSACLVSLNCGLRLLENFFLDHFLLEKKWLYISSSCFSILFNASARLFCTLSFAQSRKILSKFSKLSAILKHGGKNSVMMTSIVCLSSNSS